MSHTYAAKLLLTFSLLYGCLQGQAQTTYQPAKVIPPSPTAASLGVYGDLGVGYYSGTPSISIPLHEIKTPNHSLSITMNYNASGFRVGENASWVGLGWSLSAGGVITRTVRGMDDFTYQGFYTAAALPPAAYGNTHDSDSPDWVAHKAYFDEIKEGHRDGEPDFFSYNFGEYSGKFVYGKQADGSKTLMAESNNFKVEYIPPTANTASSWLITDGNGYKYSFGTHESTNERYVYSSDDKQIDDQGPWDTYVTTNSNLTTAWYLDSIVSPTGETILFEYGYRGYSFNSVSKTEKAYNILSQFPAQSCECSGSHFTPHFNGTYRFFNATKSMVYDVYLARISYTNGSITFTPTDRKDIEYLQYEGTSKPGKLSEILIKDAQGNRLKKYTLEYTYFNNDESISGRLKLDAVREFGETDQISKPAYNFNYYFPNNLPSKYASHSVDHFGYYNGKNNAVLFPAMIYTGNPNDPRFFAGANRTPNPSADNLKKGVLSSITYPTGGSTHFDYELNEYSNPKGIDAFDEASVEANAHNYSPGTYIDGGFELFATTAIHFTYGYEPWSPNANTLVSPIQLANLFKVMPDNTLVPVLSNFSGVISCQDPNNPNCPGTSGSDDETTILPPGKYVMKAFYQQDYHVYFTASGHQNIPITQRKGGGLRIKSITNIENGQVAKTRKFFYTADGTSTGVSTGKLIAAPRYDYTLSIAESIVCCVFPAEYFVRLSNSVFAPGLTSRGATVGYDKVTEVIGENGEGGKTVYHFYNAEDYYDLNSFPSMPSYSYPLNGKMDLMETFNATGKRLNEVDYTYQTLETQSIKGVRVYNEPGIGPPTPYDSYLIKYYDMASDWNVLQSQQEKTYSDQGDIITATQFFYENNVHKQVSRQETIQSDGSTVITKYKYPSDYTSAGSSSFATQLKLKNILSPVIEQQTLVKKGTETRLLAGTFTEYSLFHNTFYKPSVIYQIETSQPLTDLTESTISATNQIGYHGNYKPKVYFDAYENNVSGNLSMYHQEKGLSQVYLWDFNHSLLVGEVKNALAKDVFYTGFETEQGNSSDGDSYTGNKSYLSGAGSYSNALTGLTNGEYLLTYWLKQNGEWAYAATTIHVTTGSYTINLSGQIDEVRFYPKQAFMTTYSYNPWQVVTSATDATGITTYYDYDQIGRLKLIKDQNQAIRKQYIYHYKSSN